MFRGPKLFPLEFFIMSNKESLGFKVDLEIHPQVYLKLTGLMSVSLSESSKKHNITLKAQSAECM